MNKLQIVKNNDTRISFEFSKNRSILTIELHHERWDDPPFELNAGIELNVFEAKQLRDFLNNKI